MRGSGRDKGRGLRGRDEARWGKGGMENWQEKERRMRKMRVAEEGR